ncbi:MAG: trehalose-phosphatase [Acidimicrobiales bacterium]
MFLDFDGTLSPIVQDADQARALPGTARLLARLGEKFARVAVISGRPVSYLASQLGGAGATELIGLYGLERQRGEPPVTEEVPAAAPWRAVVDQVATAAERAASATAGLVVERKVLGVTLHYRRAPHLAGLAAAIAAAQAAASGLVTHPGKMSVELRPPVETDKGTVVVDLAAGLGSVLFAGDDVGDLPAFAALAHLRGSGVTTLSVAVGGGETPAEVASEADVVVEGPADLTPILEALAG